MLREIKKYGDPVLKKSAEKVEVIDDEIRTMLSDMAETMYEAPGVGLAAPQVGLSIRLFVIDTTPFSDDENLDEKEQTQLKGFKKTFINAKMLKEEGDEWGFNEGCLSIPDVREDVFRHDTITIEYFDEDFNKKTEVYDGLIARVIQHEYDHIEGILFTDHLSILKKKLIGKKLQNIMDGKARPDYKMKYVNKKGR